MFDRHRLAHAGLAAVYVVTATVLALEGAAAHAACAVAAALLYAVLCREGPHTPTSPAPPARTPPAPPPPAPPAR